MTPQKQSLDLLFVLPIFFLTILSVLVLASVAGSLFPFYYLYIFLGVVIFFLFNSLGFTFFSAFKNHIYIFSIIFLLLPLFIGQVTRGAIRWIPIGALTIQPAEIVRPFLLVFFANYLVETKLSGRERYKALLLLFLPLILILIQPSLGVAVLTFIGIVGVFISSGIEKKHFLIGIAGFLLVIPISWFFLAPYQKDRVTGFLNPEADPLGAGYNSIQSMISIGSGKFFGRGLGKGVQTQLSFLPERHTDFIFASIAEELGLVGAIFLLSFSFLLLFKLIGIIEKAESPMARAFVAGLFLSYLAQITVHVGMNLGLLPITGIPYPLVSAGGSSYLATMMGLGIAFSAKKT